MGAKGAVRHQLVHPAADHPHQIEIRRPGIRTHVVDPSRLSRVRNALQGARVVLDEQPVPHVPPVAVDGDGPPLQRGKDRDRYQLLGHLEGAVAVGAVADEDRQAVGAVPGPGEVVRGRLAGGVGGIRPVRRNIGEDAHRRLQRAVDLVGRDVQKAKGFPLRGRQSAPVRGRRLQQRHRPLHVGGHEVHRPVDGAIDVGFGREMDHRVRSGVRENPAQCATVANVGLLEGVVGSVEGDSQRLDVARVGQQVDGRDVPSRGDQPAHDARSDEARSARDQYAFQGATPPAFPDSERRALPPPTPFAGQPGRRSHGGSLASRMASRTP